LENKKTDWHSISPLRIKTELQKPELQEIEGFSSIEFDDENKIKCTPESVDLILEIIREVYSRNLFTNKVIETKGIA
jgi:hypothetical protein